MDDDDLDRMMAETEEREAKVRSNGSIDEKELKNLIVEMGFAQHIPSDQLDIVVKMEMQKADTNKNGSISFEEFIPYFNSMRNLERIKSGEAESISGSVAAANSSASAPAPEPAPAVEVVLMGDFPDVDSCTIAEEVTAPAQILEKADSIHAQKKHPLFLTCNEDTHQALNEWFSEDIAKNCCHAPTDMQGLGRSHQADKGDYANLTKEVRDGYEEQLLKWVKGLDGLDTSDYSQGFSGTKTDTIIENSINMVLRGGTMQ
eukprot:gene29799-37163_t